MQTILLFKLQMCYVYMKLYFLMSSKNQTILCKLFIGPLYSD